MQCYWLDELLCCRVVWRVADVCAAEGCLCSVLSGPSLTLRRATQLYACSQAFSRPDELGINWCGGELLPRDCGCREGAWSRVEDPALSASLLCWLSWGLGSPSAAILYCGSVVSPWMAQQAKLFEGLLSEPPEESSPTSVFCSSDRKLP